MPLPLMAGMDKNEAFQNWLKGKKDLQRLQENNNMTPPTSRANTFPDADINLMDNRQNMSLMPDTRQNMNVPDRTPQFMSMAPETVPSLRGRMDDPAEPHSGLPGFGPPPPMGPPRSLMNVHDPDFQPTDRVQLNKSAIPNLMASNDLPDPTDALKKAGLIRTDAGGDPMAYIRGLSQPAKPSLSPMGQPNVGPQLPPSFRVGSATEPDLPTATATPPAPIGPSSKVPNSRMTVEMPGSSVTYGFRDGEYTQPVGATANGKSLSIGDYLSGPKGMSVADWAAGQDPNQRAGSRKLFDAGNGQMLSFDEIKRMSNPTWAPGQVGGMAGETKDSQAATQGLIGQMSENQRSQARIAMERAQLAQHGELGRGHLDIQRAAEARQKADSDFLRSEDGRLKQLAGSMAAQGKSPAEIAIAIKNAKEASAVEAPAVQPGAAGTPLQTAETDFRKALPSVANEIVQMIQPKADGSLPFSNPIEAMAAIGRKMGGAKSNEFLAANMRHLFPYLNSIYKDEKFKEQITPGPLNPTDVSVGEAMRSSPFNILRPLTGPMTEDDRVKAALRKYLAEAGNKRFLR